MSRHLPGALSDGVHVDGVDVLRRTLTCCVMACLLGPIVAVGSPQPCPRTSIRPFVESSEEYAAAVREARAGHSDAAIAILDSMQSAPDKQAPVPTEAIAFAKARLLEDARRPDDAIAIYQSLRTSHLSDTALFREGLIHLRRGETSAARVAFAAISRASSDWVLARLALSHALLRESRPNQAALVMRDLLAADLSDRDLHEARLNLARVRWAAGDAEGASAAALTAYLEATDAVRAREAALFLSRTATPVDRVTEMARSLFGGNPSDLTRLVRRARRGRVAMKRLDPGLPDAIAGMAMAGSGKEPDAAISRLKVALDRTRHPLLRAGILLVLAETLAVAGDDEGAIAAIQTLRLEHPRGPFAGPAAIVSARLSMREADYDEALATLKGIAASHPESGLDHDALWEMALAALVTNRPAAALAHLDEAARLADSGEGLLMGLAEKTCYFRGVVLHQLGRIDEGVTQLHRVARNYPHSYYSVLAVSRLQEWTGTLPGHANAITPLEPEACAGPSMVEDATLPVCGPALGPLLLWRLGFVAEGIVALRAKARHGLLGEQGMVLLATIEMARHPTGVSRAQKLLRGLPSDDTESLFARAYPRPYGTEVNRAVLATGVDPALIYGVMRAESRFQPRARSPAGAVGLMQLMPASAKVVARKVLAAPKLARAYRRPEANILIGSALLAELGRHFHDHLPLMLTGYNAGSGAARKFYRRLHHLPTDLFVEALPYGATSMYVKTVIAYAAGYRAFYDRDGRGPLTLSTRLPDELGPFMKPAASAPSEPAGAALASP